MHSRFYTPQTPQLKDLIHSIWQVERFNAVQKELILPKGVVEVIFNFSNSAGIRAELGSRVYQLSHCFINGFNTAPIQLHLPAQQIFFGVVFQPLAVKKLFKTPAGEFSDNLVDLALLDAAFFSLWQQLAEQSTFDSRVAVFGTWLERKCPQWQLQEKRINQFLYASQQHTLTVQELANSLCYSPRQLARKMIEATGVNTEEVLLYKKYLHAVHLMHHTDLSLTEIAYQSHFSDQSHFIKSFKSYSGMTPGDYRRQKSILQGHLYESFPPVQDSMVTA